VVPHIVRRVALLAVLALLALGGSAALAGPGAVIDDYQADGRIDGVYNVGDLQGALDLMKDQAQYGAFRDLVGDAMVSAAAGLRSRERGAAVESRSAPPPPTADPAGTAKRSQETGAARDTPNRLQAELPGGLPSSPPTDPDSGLPVGFVVLSALAGALLVAGVGSTAYRRLRR
jgi:hypothetical protein